MGVWGERIWLYAHLFSYHWTSHFQIFTPPLKVSSDLLRTFSEMVFKFPAIFPYHDSPWIVVVSILLWAKSPFQSNCFETSFHCLFSPNLKVRCHCFFLSTHCSSCNHSLTAHSARHPQTILLSFLHFPRLAFCVYTLLHTL